MDGDRGRDGTGGARLGMDHLAVVALTLLLVLVALMAR